jgi:hypothetical protein
MEKIEGGKERESDGNCNYGRHEPFSFVLHCCKVGGQTNIKQVKRFVWVEGIETHR